VLYELLACTIANNDNAIVPLCSAYLAELVGLRQGCR